MSCKISRQNILQLNIIYFICIVLMYMYKTLYKDIQYIIFISKYICMYYIFVDNNSFIYFDAKKKQHMCSFGIFLLVFVFCSLFSLLHNESFLSTFIKEINRLFLFTQIYIHIYIQSIYIYTNLYNKTRK